MFDRIRTSPSLRFAAGCLAFLAGIAVHAVRETPFLPGFGARGWLAAALVVAATLSMAAFRTHRATMVALLLLVAAGIFRHDAVLSTLPLSCSPALPLCEIATRLPTRVYTGLVADAPKSTPYGTQLVLESDPGRDPLPGRFLVTTQDRMDVFAGDIVEWSCAGDEVRAEPGPGYDDYLRVRGIAYRCSVRFAPKIVGHQALSPPAAAMDALRRAVRSKADALYPEPDASMLMGLLIGQTDGLTRDLKDAFRETGTSHILAVSGYNVTQLVALMTFLLAAGGLARRRATIATAGIVVAFTILAGADASVVRAACMGCTALVARLYRRRYGGVIALLAAAAAMAAVNPLVLAHDAGFQLSFLAVMGLQAFGKPLERFFAWMPEVAGFRRMAAETSAATLATLPLTLYAFGMLPPMAFIVNLLVLPCIPVVMVVGAVSLLIGIPMDALGFLPALSASFLIRYALVVIRAAALWQPAFAVRIPAWGLVIGYACVVALWRAVHRPKPTYLRKKQHPV